MMMMELKPQRQHSASNISFGISSLKILKPFRLKGAN